MTRHAIVDDLGASCGPDSCSPTTAGNKSLISTTLALSPVFLTFAFAFSVALTRLFPALARLQQQQQQQQYQRTGLQGCSSQHLPDGGGGISIDDGQDHFLPASAPASLRQAHAE